MLKNNVMITQTLSAANRIMIIDDNDLTHYLSLHSMFLIVSNKSLTTTLYLAEITHVTNYVFKFSGGSPNILDA